MSLLRGHLSAARTTTFYQCTSLASDSEYSDLFIVLQLPQGVRTQLSVRAPNLSQPWSKGFSLSA